MSTLMRTLTIVTAVGAGAMGGVFFTFSAFVMPALARLPAPQGISAMQSINITAVRPVFMTALFGTAALCVVLAVNAFRTWGDRRALLLLIGAAVYAVGVIVLTAAYHVPLNDSLATLDPASPGAVATWNDYVGHWTTWNHVRAGSGIVASAAFILAARR